MNRLEIFESKNYIYIYIWKDIRAFVLSSLTLVHASVLVLEHGELVNFTKFLEHRS